MVYYTKNIKEVHKFYLKESKKYLEGKNIDQEYTKYYMNKYGYNNMRRINTNTIQKPYTIICTNCNNPGHYAYNCSKKNRNNHIFYEDDY